MGHPLMGERTDTAMRASAWNDGKNTYGTSVGKPNRDEFFCRDWKFIKVEVDGRFYRFGLTGGIVQNSVIAGDPLFASGFDATGRSIGPTGNHHTWSFFH